MVSLQYALMQQPPDIKACSALDGLDVTQDCTSEAKARIAFNLLSADRSQPTVLFIVYATIKANSSITLNQLRWLLHTEFLFPESLIDSAVGTLSSESLFNVVKKWWASDRPDIVRLSVKAETETSVESSFKVWLHDLYVEFPELKLFVPPTFKKKLRGSQ